MEHGTTHLSVNNKVFDLLGQVWEHFITVILKHYCKEFYGVSLAACSWSGHFNIKSKGVLYNSIDLSEIESLMEEPVCSYKKELNIPENATVITFTGRILPEKGVPQLIEAVKQLNRENVYLLVAGDGPLFEELKDKYSKAIFLGRLDFAHVIALLKESDIFCLPSVSEGFSTSVLEAVAARNFIITTKTGGTKELICEKKYGIIMDGNTVEEVIDALKTAIDDTEYRLSATKNAYERLKENFIWSKTAQKLERIMKNEE